MDPKQVLKPVGKLKKAIRKLPKTPSPEEVHQLRTQSRRLEAVLHALRFERTKRGRRLLKLLTPLLKGAGKVRDMDVLTGLAASVPNRSDDNADQPDDAVIMLLELLGSRRWGFAKRLHQTVAARRKDLLKELKRFRARVEKSHRPAPGGGAAPTDPTAVAAGLAGELAAWPRIGRNTLHPYRLKVKELGYILQLAQEPDARLIEALKETKDRIGIWHDWCELEDVAREMPGSDDHLVHRVHSIAESELERALSSAMDLKKKHLAAAKAKRGRHKPARIQEPILISAARLSA